VLERRRRLRVRRRLQSDVQHRTRVLERALVVSLLRRPIEVWSPGELRAQCAGLPADARGGPGGTSVHAERVRQRSDLLVRRDELHVRRAVPKGSARAAAMQSRRRPDHELLRLHEHAMGMPGRTCAVRDAPTSRRQRVHRGGCAVRAHATGAGVWAAAARVRERRVDAPERRLPAVTAGIASSSPPSGSGVRTFEAARDKGARIDARRSGRRTHSRRELRTAKPRDAP
jgi:hypothetical protein